MGRKKKSPAQAEPAEATPEAADTTPATTEEGGEKQSKSALIKALLTEMAAMGRHQEIKSNQGLIAELRHRHPSVDWKDGDVPQAKAKWMKEQTGASGQEGHGRKPTARKGTTTDEVSLSDLRAVARLAAEMGGIDKLSEAVSAIRDINNVK